MILKNNEIKIGFFGTPDYAVTTLNILKSASFDIKFVVTMPDRPSGRKMILTSPPVKIWAEKNNITFFQPENLREKSFVKNLKKYECDVFIVIAYGKIIPNSILNIPKYKSLNIHGSLLPKLRGSCPIETAILNDEKNTGVTIIRMDEKMDHGPIIDKKKVEITPWPPKAKILGEEIVKAGSDLLVSILPKWINSEIKEIEQDHSQATFTKMIQKGDGLINLKDDPYKNFLKIQAYDGWPSTFFFKDGKRIKITQASFFDRKLTIEKIIPEGKSETIYRE